MDCCRPQAAPLPTSGFAGLEPLQGLVVAEVSGTASASEQIRPVAFSRVGALHPLGLFTLHSVWRI